MQTIGFIGLGAMGQGMAANLVTAGFTVRGFDVRDEALDEAAGNGVLRSASPADAARGAELLVVVVFTADQADDVLFGANGALATLATGATVLMATTMSPARMQALEARLEAERYRLVDAPITGGVAGAEEGSLTFIASGDPAALDAARPAMTAMGAKIAVCGERAGAGSTVKLVNQLMCGVMVAASAEGIALAAKAGADPAVVFDVISSGAARSLVWDTRVKTILERGFKQRGGVDIFTKDLDIVLEAGKALSFPLPITAAAMQQYLAAEAMGFGRSDDCAVVKVYEALAGVDVAAVNASR